MKTLKRNQQTFYYCLFDSVIFVKDKNGNETGEKIVKYLDPVSMEANISHATVRANIEQFGIIENYDKVIVTDDMDCPIDENSVLFIDKEPVYTDAVTVDYQESKALYGEDIAIPVTVEVPAFDYIVRRVSKSLNSISIAVSKVKVS